MAFAAQADPAGGTGSAPEAYLKWYYDTGVWTRTTFLGVPILKSVSDLWNYQEILWQLQPSLVIEFGAAFGGSALFFATTLAAVNPLGRVLSFDIDLSRIHERARAHSAIDFVEASTADPAVAERIIQERSQQPGPIFVILDSDHTKPHVLSELNVLRAATRLGDYIVVEDGIVNGNPVLPGWGEGPLEALNEYLAAYPGEYFSDTDREQKFGFTFAPRGFLIRR